MKNYRFHLLLSSLCLILGACTGVPKGLTPVENFNLTKYLGTWYEIARLDHKEERGMSHVSATYSVREKGGITVLNKGYVAREGIWKNIEGKAFLNGERDQGRLKVSFFGPFYGGYNIVVLDEDYQYVMVAGPDLSYLWIMARSPDLDEKIITELTKQAKEWGFATEELIRVSHVELPENK